MNPLPIDHHTRTVVNIVHALERRRTAAYWYAVGWADASGETDIADVFADYARNQAKEYYTERTSHLRSVPDQWQEFRESVHWLDEE